MGRPRRTTCRNCERHIGDCGPLSAAYLCEDCGIGKMERNALSLNAHAGDQFNHWRARCILAMGGVVPENLLPYVEKPDTSTH